VNKGQILKLNYAPVKPSHNRLYVFNKEIFGGLIMQHSRCKNNGIELLLQRYKKIFRIPENINYYSKPDYQIAEKKFLKYSLKSSCV
jgi:hypothetical protein